MGKIQEIIKDIPLFTFSLIILCSIIFIYTELIDNNSLMYLSEYPHHIVYKFQIYVFILLYF